MKLKRKPAPFITITMPMYPWFQKLLNEGASTISNNGGGSLSHLLIDLAMTNMASRGIISGEELGSWKKIDPESGKTTPFTERKEHEKFSVYVPKDFAWVKDRLKQAAEINVKDHKGERLTRSVSKYLCHLFYIKNYPRVLVMQDAVNKGRADKDLQDYKKEWQEYLGKYKAEWQAYLEKSLQEASSQSYKRGTDKNSPQKVLLSPKEKVSAKQKEKRKPA